MQVALDIIDSKLSTIGHEIGLVESDANCLLNAKKAATPQSSEEEEEEDTLRYLERCQTELNRILAVVEDCEARCRSIASNSADVTVIETRISRCCQCREQAEKAKKLVDYTTTAHWSQRIEKAKVVLKQLKGLTIAETQQLQKDEQEEHENSAILRPEIPSQPGDVVQLSQPLCEAKKELEALLREQQQIDEEQSRKNPSASASQPWHCDPRRRKTSAAS